MRQNSARCFSRRVFEPENKRGHATTASAVSGCLDGLCSDVKCRKTTTGVLQSLQSLSTQLRPAKHLADLLWRMPIGGKVGGIWWVCPTKLLTRNVCTTVLPRACRVLVTFTDSWKTSNFPKLAPVGKATMPADNARWATPDEHVPPRWPRRGRQRRSSFVAVSLWKEHGIRASFHGGAIQQ